MQDYVRGSQQRGSRDMLHGGRGGGGPGRGKSKLNRPNTVVSEGGKRLRVFETDASESGEDVSAFAPVSSRCITLSPLARGKQDSRGVATRAVSLQPRCGVALTHNPGDIQTSEWLNLDACEQVPSKNAHLPYEPAGGRRGGFGGGGGGGHEGGNDYEGAGGMGFGGMGGGDGGKKDKGKDNEIVAINADISTMEIDEVRAQASQGSLGLLVCVRVACTVLCGVLKHLLACSPSGAVDILHVDWGARCTHPQSQGKCLPATHLP